MARMKATACNCMEEKARKLTEFVMPMKARSYITAENLPARYIRYRQQDTEQRLNTTTGNGKKTRVNASKKIKANDNVSLTACALVSIVSEKDCGTLSMFRSTQPSTVYSTFDA